MTDKEIIQALEYCIVDACDICPCREEASCVRAMVENALDLINRQQAEIDRLKNNIQYFYSEEHMEQMEFEKKAIEYNAISKFAEKVENKLGIPFMVNNQVVGIVLDETIKEMVGADNG